MTRRGARREVPNLSVDDDLPIPLRETGTRVGVLLMSFGTAATLDDVPAYLAAVRGGRPAPDELLAEFRRRFARVGGSPLTQITAAQATALETQLNFAVEGPTYRVAIGMRHAPPFIADGLTEIVRTGVQRVVAIVMSPQYSPTIMGGYLRALEAARTALMHDIVGHQIPVAVARAWHDEPHFVAAMAERVEQALGTVPEPERSTVPVLFTAHSLPRSVADGEPGYIRQLHDTAQAIAAAAALPAARWQFAYQSAGHTPEPWLTPDVKDLLPDLYRAGHRSVLVAPVQFLADHLEVLYDIDVAAREEAAAQGIKLMRTESLNTMPAFVEALAAVVRRTA